MRFAYLPLSADQSPLQGIYRNFLLLVLFVAPVLTVAAVTTPATFGIGTGIRDPFRSSHALDLTADYRLASESRWQARLVGNYSTDGAYFVGAGALLHVGGDGNRRWDITVGFAPGYYEHTNGRNLGKALEFFSTVEISRRFSRDRRLGLSLGHISNGSLGDHNPGAETIHFFWLVPLTPR
jgi:hypothetical protein